MLPEAYRRHLSVAKCGLYVADGWTTDDLVFLWKEGDPVQVVKNLHLPRFTLERFLTDYCNSKTNTGIFWLFRSGAAGQSDYRKRSKEFGDKSVIS